LGHFVHHDLTRAAGARLLLRVTQAAALAAVIVARPGDLSLLRTVAAGMFAFALVETAGVPLMQWILRRHERQANQWLLYAANDPSALLAAYEALHVRLGCGGEPSRWQRLWFASHPSLADVRRQAQRFQQIHAKPTEQA
jgi:hypothetical protein